MKWTFTLPEQLDICVFFFFVVFSLDCSIFLRSLALLFLSLIILRGEGRIADLDTDRTWERKEELLTGCISFTIKYPRSAHKLLNTYLSIICIRRTNKDAVSPVGVSKRYPCCCGFVLFSCMYTRERSSEESDRVM